MMAWFTVLLLQLLSALNFSMYTSPWRSHGIRDSARHHFSAVAVNNTVVIVPVNMGMLNLAENLLCSLRHTSFNVSNVLFWALDREAENVLAGKGHRAYHDPTLFGSSSNENNKGVTKNYKRMMRDRPKFFIDVLTSGYDIIMLDADTVFFQSPLLIAPSLADTTKVDIVYSTDGRDFYHESNAFRDPRRRGNNMPPICNGIFWMKSGPRTISLWTEMLSIFEQSWPLGPMRRLHSQDDQRAMDVLLNDGRAMIVEPFPTGIKGNTIPKVRNNDNTVRVRLLDQTKVANGYLLRERQETYNRSLAKLRELGEDRIAAHFNWNTKQVSKVHGAKALSMYFLDDMGHCRLDV